MKKLVIAGAALLAIGQLRAQHGRCGKPLQYYSHTPRVIVLASPQQVVYRRGYCQTYSVQRPLINVVFQSGQNNCAAARGYQLSPETIKEWVEAHWEATSNGRVWVEGHYVIREVQ